jgi:hypothetical protein
MLETEYNRVFDYIVIVCPTINWNTTYLNWSHLNDHGIVKVPCSQEMIDHVLQAVSIIFRIHYNTSSLILTNNINDYNYQQNIQTYTDINNIRATFTHRDPPRTIHPLAASGVCHMINTRKLATLEIYELWHQHSFFT